MRRARTNASRRISSNWSIRRSASITAGSSRPHATADRDLDLAEERRLRFRIGVNLGDVIVDGDDIYGDGVNIAARLEVLAAPGSICVSGTVRDHIGDRLPYASWDMGEQSVKSSSQIQRAATMALDDNAFGDGSRH